MTDRIEKMLSIALQDANKALGEARRSVRVIEADANEIERLLSLHLQSKQVEAETTQAWDPALVANGSAPSQTALDRSADVAREAELQRRMAPWLRMIGQYVTVTDKDGTLTGWLTSVTTAAVTLQAEQGEPRIPTENIASVVPAQPTPPPADQPTPPGRP